MKVKMRMPNELFYDEVEIEPNHFKPETFFDNEVFGKYRGVYVAMEIGSFNKIKNEKFGDIQ